MARPLAVVAKWGAPQAAGYWRGWRVGRRCAAWAPWVGAAAGSVVASLVAGVLGIVGFVVNAAVRKFVARTIWRGVARKV